MRLIDADALIDKTDDRYSLHEIGRRERDDIVDALEYAPTIQPEPHWIPVTERLPDEDQPVLVTDGAVMWVCSLIRTDDGYRWENNMGYWHDFDEWSAWMPLPEPYKGVTE